MPVTSFRWGAMRRESHGRPVKVANRKVWHEGRQAVMYLLTRASDTKRSWCGVDPYFVPERFRSSEGRAEVAAELWKARRDLIAYRAHMANAGRWV